MKYHMLSASDSIKKVFRMLLLMVFGFLQGSTDIRAQDKPGDDLDIGRLIRPVDSSNIFIDPGYYIWCGSAIQGEDGRYYLFYARWPHGPRTPDDDSLNRIFNGFRGWQKYSEIAIAVSANPTGPYRHLKTILKGDFQSDRWDRYTFHNPQVNFFEGRYYLYFISNGFTDNMHFSRKLSVEQLHWYKYNCTQRIGVASSADIAGFLDGSFRRNPDYLVKPDSVRTWEVTVNPSVTRGPDGRYYMMYKSRKPDLGHMTFWMAVAPTPEGPFTHYSEVSTDADMACEDPYLWYDKKRGRFYAIAKNFARNSRLAPEFGALVLLTSKDGKKWEAGRHTLVSLKKLQFRNGSETKLTHLERPFLLFDRKGRMKALFAAASVDNPFTEQTTNVSPRENTFNVHIPLDKR
jgi:hypothetical protein